MHGFPDWFFWLIISAYWLTIIVLAAPVVFVGWLIARRLWK